jgi:hypothetical protein
MIVSSSPRGSGLYGLVLVFEFPENELWLPYQALFGEQFGAYYGSVLLSLDVNRDGLDELFVSAPLRSASKNQKKKEKKNKDLTSNLKEKQKKPLSGDEGCVFVYSSKDVMFYFQK